MKFIEKPKTREIFEAIQWNGSKINNNIPCVVVNDPWVATGGYYDRFSDRTDEYVLINGQKENIRAGYWVIFHNGIPTDIRTSMYEYDFYNGTLEPGVYDASVIR